MTNFKIRILFFIISVPAVLSIVFFFPYYNFIVVLFAMSISGVICGFEFRALLYKINRPVSKFAALLPGLPPILSWLINMKLVTQYLPGILLAAGIYWAFSEGIFDSKQPAKSKDFIGGGNLLILFYPTWFFWWMARLTWYDNASVVMLIFLVTVITNDSMAWLFGILFGRHKGIFPVSPNKSIEGYIGGMLSAIIVLLLAEHLLLWFNLSIWKTIVLGIVIVIAANCGDLFESRLKRYAGVKDSGKIMSVRGGMLDSIDSWLFAAPIFNLIINLAV